MTRGPTGFHSKPIRAKQNNASPIPPPSARFRRPAPLADWKRRPETPAGARRTSMSETTSSAGTRARAAWDCASARAHGFAQGWSFPDARVGRPDSLSVHVRGCVPARPRACRRRLRVRYPWASWSLTVRPSTRIALYPWVVTPGTGWWPPLDGRAMMAQEDSRSPEARSCWTGMRCMRL